MLSSHSSPGIDYTVNPLLQRGTVFRYKSFFFPCAMTYFISIKTRLDIKLPDENDCWSSVLNHVPSQVSFISGFAISTIDWKRYEGSVTARSSGTTRRELPDQKVIFKNNFKSLQFLCLESPAYRLWKCGCGVSKLMKSLLTCKCSWWW